MIIAVAALLAGTARADSTLFPDRLGPSISISGGGGYSFFDNENGGVSILAMGDLGWFVTDRVAVLAGATLVSRPGDEFLHHTLWRLGVELRVDPRHYFRVSAGRSIVSRERDELDTHEGLETLGKGEGLLAVAGVPAGWWGWGEVSFQFVAGGGVHHGDDTESSWTVFVATCLEFAIR